MKPWPARPLEVRNLLNPAFCAMILMRALGGYREENTSGMPFSLSLLILPLCLHRMSRDTLAKHNRGYFLKILTDHPHLVVGFPARAATLLPYSLESLGFAMHMGCFDVSQEGLLRPVSGGLRKTVAGTDETVACQRVARFVGKQFAQIGDRVTVYTALGIRP